MLTMKGLEISRGFFFEWGLPFLKNEFPEIADRVAAGRLAGSDVLGADDEISRDHNWGPQFTLFLSAEDYAAFGERLSASANTAAPALWKGYRVAGAGDKNVMVTSIPDWFASRLNLSHPPQSDNEWLPLINSESHLYYLRHGAVWMDGSGELSVWRKALHQWPEYLLTKRLADECFRTWHHGEYNFVSRMAKRRDPLAISICLGEFVSGVMRTVLLANGDYTPYWKWLPFVFRQEPEAPAYLPLLEQLVRSSDIDEQIDLVNEISGKVHRKLVSACNLTSKDKNPYLLPLLNDYNELSERLREFEKAQPNETSAGSA